MYTHTREKVGFDRQGRKLRVVSDETTTFAPLPFLAKRPAQFSIATATSRKKASSHRVAKLPTFLFCFSNGPAVPTRATRAIFSYSGVLLSSNFVRVVLGQSYSQVASCTRALLQLLGGRSLLEALASLDGGRGERAVERERAHFERAHFERATRSWTTPRR